MPSRATMGVRGRPGSAEIHSSRPPGTERLWGMRTREDDSRRTRLVPGTRATILWVGSTPDRQRQWRRQRVARRGTHRTTVAVANTNAYMVWVWRSRPHDNRSMTNLRPPPRADHGHCRRYAPRAQAAHEEVRRRLRLGGIADHTMRGVLEVITRWLRPAFPDADVVQGHEGRSVEQEEKHPCHQGLRAGRGLDDQSR
jgi:hypothetical protein